MFGKRKSKSDALKVVGYDYSSRERREETVGRLYAKAKNARTAIETQWVQFNDYYNFLHNATGEIREAVRESRYRLGPCRCP